MRWLSRSRSRSLLSLLAASLSLSLLSSSQQVAASCVSALVKPDTAQTPDANALTMFVLGTTTNGDLITKSHALPGGSTISDPLVAADYICTQYAGASANAKASYNQNSAGGTVQFTSLISTTTTDAISRITPSVNIVSYSATNGKKCIAASVSDLFTASNGAGYQFEASGSVDTVYDQNGNSVGQNIAVWTGIGVPAAATGSAASATAASYGGRYYPQGAPPAGGDYTSLAGTDYCNNWSTSSSSNSASSGLLNPSANNGANSWFQQLLGAEIQSCTQGYRIFCLSAQPYQGPTTPAVVGDPQFTGLQGQQFQVHGMPDEFFNLITTPTFQLNSRFTYIASGRCDYNNTECWTHPGTYVDQLGFMFPGINIKTVAGPHHKGLRVWINDEEMHKSHKAVVMTTTTTIGVNTTDASTSASEVSISHPHHDVLVVSFPLYTIEVTNSDWFFNFNLVFHAPEVLEAGRDMHYLHDSRPHAAAKPAYLNDVTVYPAYPMHGLVGQTWKNARYAAKRMYQGEIDDYMLLDHQLFSTQFLFNLYAY